MSATLPLNIDQIKSLIGQCDIDEKIELIRYLERETFAVRFRDLLNRLKTDEISMDAITAEVEDVRRKRYERSN